MHDYIIAMSFQVISYGFVLGMLSQAIYVKIGTLVGKWLHIENSTYCNWFAWFNIVAALTSWSIAFYLKLLENQK